MTKFFSDLDYPGDHTADAYPDGDIDVNDTRDPPETLAEGDCHECAGAGWVVGERMGGQFEQLTCCECDGTGRADGVAL